MTDLTHIIICPGCGKIYHRKRPIWSCACGMEFVWDGVPLPPLAKLAELPIFPVDDVDLSAYLRAILSVITPIDGSSTGE